MQATDQPVLAVDRVGRRKQIPERFATKDIITRGSFDPVCGVGLTPGEFGQAERAGEPLDMRVEPRAKRGLVDRLLAHRYFLYSSRAMARRWTSSGPSASRSMRIDA